MNDSVQLFHASALESGLCQQGTINLAVSTHNALAEAPHQLVVNRLAFSIKLVCDFVRRITCTPRLENISAIVDLPQAIPPVRPTRSIDYLSLRRSLHASTVFAMSIAMVNGPTPPGTGVIAPATSATLGSTSPTSVEPFSENDFSRAALPAKNFSNSARCVILLVPTSITAAPGFTKSLVTSPALPIAAIRISA